MIFKPTIIPAMAKDPIEELDLNGDVVLVVTGESPQSIRKLLALATPVFAVLFSRKYSEGIEIIKSLRPEVKLNDEYSDAMQIRVFHFRELEKVDERMLANIEILF